MIGASRDDVEFEMRLSMSGQKEQDQKGRANVAEVPGITEGEGKVRVSGAEFE